MAAETFTFNIAKGRPIEFYNRVKNNDPANSALVLVPLSVGGTEAQGQDFDTLAAVLADANFDEQTTGGWARVVLDDADLAALPAPDDTSDLYGVALPEITYTTPATGSDVAQFLLCYDPDTTAGTDSNIIPVTAHARAIVANDLDVIIDAGDFFQAS